MRTVGGLFERIADLDNLLAAFHAASLGKAKRAEVIAFRASLHVRLTQLRAQILDGAVTFGNYRVFTIRDPKTRTIQAAPFEQRVVHHAMVRIVAPTLERSLIDHCYACRKGKGQHAAAAAAQRFCRRAPFYLKMDIDKFYDGIDHQRLLELLARRLRERRLLDLFDNLLNSYHTRPGCGLPIGNLTSQYLGNFYLDSFDHWTTEGNGFGRYVRYMDDMLVFGGQDALRDQLAASRDWLREHLALAIKHGGELNRCSRGVPFVGWVLYPNRVRLGKGPKKRFSRRLRRLEKAFRDGAVDECELQTRATALCAALAHRDCSALRASVAKRGKVPAEYA